MAIGSCSRCKIVVIKCHMLQFGMLRGKMANSPTCPSQLAPAPHFVLQIRHLAPFANLPRLPLPTSQCRLRRSRANSRLYKWAEHGDLFTLQIIPSRAPSIWAEPTSSRWARPTWHLSGPSTVGSVYITPNRARHGAEPG